MDARSDRDESELRRRAGAGDLEAMKELGDLLYDAVREPEAERWYREAAEAGHTPAAFNLGCLLSNTGEPPGTVEAERWLREAAARGYGPASAALGRIALRAKDYAAAQSYLEAAERDGDVRARFSLAMVMKQLGRDAEAEALYRRAAAGGDLDAMFNLGVLLHERGDTEEAEQWYLRAVDRGDADAMFHLGILCKERGETADTLRWYREAARCGHQRAIMNLGFMLEWTGELEEAERWYRTGADRADGEAMFGLANLLRVAGREDEAESWYRHAAAAHERSAEENLRAMLDERRAKASGRPRRVFYLPTRDSAYLWPRDRPRCESGNGWRRAAAKWTRPAQRRAADPVALPVVLDLTGFEPYDTGLPQWQGSWLDRSTADLVLVGVLDGVLPLPGSAAELADLQRSLARDLAGSGCLIEADLVRAGGARALLQLWKSPIPGREHGQVFTAQLTIPGARRTANLRYQAREHGTTGMREAVMAIQLGVTHGYFIPHPYDPELKSRLAYHRGDEAAWDARFPHHPLSRARDWIRRTAADLVFEPGFRR
jgi:TPR repeat protein